MRKFIVTSGVESEYVLRGVSDYIRGHGYDVFEMEFGSFKEDPYVYLEQFRSRDVVYITSAHTNLTRVVSGVLTPTFLANYPNYISPLEIMAFLNPVKSIYVPHDLLTPYGDVNLNEYRFLSLFDFILAPFSAKVLQATLGQKTKVLDAGWVKVASSNVCEEKLYGLSDLPKVALFVSMIEHLRLRFGVEGVVDYFRPLVKGNVKIKLPAWKGVHEIEYAFEQAFPGCIIPAEISSIRLINESDVVVCNGASSIHAEAILLGKPTVCLLDNEGITLQQQKKKLGSFPFIFFHDYRNRQPIKDDLFFEVVCMKNNIGVSRFDFDVILDVISSS